MMNKKSQPVILEAVQGPDGVYRVPAIVEKTEWKFHYYGFDPEMVHSNEELRKYVHERMVKDLERMTRELFRMVGS